MENSENSNFDLMTEVSKIQPEQPKRKKRNYFEVLQNMKSNDGHMYGRRCFGTLCSNHMGQYWLRPNDSVKRHISLRHSCYATVNTFKRGGEVMKNKRNGSKYKWYHHSDKLVTGLCGLYVDLDAKNINMQYGSQLFFIYPHLLDIAELPMPSFAIDSGHGIHLLWLFDSEVVIHNSRILPMWQKVEDLFVSRLAKASKDYLGTSKLVDSTVHDPARYLRVPDSYNCKNNDDKLFVNTLEDNYVTYSFMGYHSGLYYDYIGCHSRKWVNNLFVNKKRLQAKKMNKKSNEKASTASVSSGLINRNDHLGKQAYLLINRLRDYEEVVKLRNSKHVYSGYRNELIFLYAQDRVKLRGKHSLMHDVKGVNSSFHNPLGTDELKQILRINGSYDSSLSQYHYTNAMIMSGHHLGLTDDEQRHMRTLTDSAERNRRKRIANHKGSIRCHEWRRRKGLIGSMTKSKWQRKKNFSKAMYLLKTKSKRAVAKEIGISRRTLIRWEQQHKQGCDIL